MALLWKKKGWSRTCHVREASSMTKRTKAISEPVIRYWCGGEGKNEMDASNVSPWSKMFWCKVKIPVKHHWTSTVNVLLGLTFDMLWTAGANALLKSLSLFRLPECWIRFWNPSRIHYDGPRPPTKTIRVKSYIAPNPPKDVMGDFRQIYFKGVTKEAMHPTQLRNNVTQDARDRPQ